MAQGCINPRLTLYNWCWFSSISWGLVAWGVWFFNFRIHSDAPFPSPFGTLTWLGNPNVLWEKVWEYNLRVKYSLAHQVGLPAHVWYVRQVVGSSHGDNLCWMVDWFLQARMDKHLLCPAKENVHVYEIYLYINICICPCMYVNHVVSCNAMQRNAITVM